MKAFTSSFPYALRLLALFAALTFAPQAAGDSVGGAAVHPLLRSLIEEPSATIPEHLTLELGGLQGRHRIDGRPALSLHLETDASPEDLEAAGARVRSASPGRATIDLLPEHLPELAARSDVSAIALPVILQPTLDASMPVLGVDHLRGQFGGGFTGLTGAGVIVGVVDTGIDLTHPNFQDPSGNTRILYTLDQTSAGGLAICSAAEIDAGTCAHRDDISGHGTHVAGIAAGNGAAVDGSGLAYRSVGVAPEADIIAVRTTFATDDLEDAIEFIFDRADDLGRPAVVNLSLTGHYAAHDGATSLERHIDHLVAAQPGRAVVSSAGNQRQDAIHAEVPTEHAVSQVGPEFEIDSYAPGGAVGDDVLVITGYYPDADNLEIYLTTPTGEFLTQQLDSSGQAACSEAVTASGFVSLCNSGIPTFGGSTAANEIVVTVLDVNPGTGRAVTPPATGTWSLIVSGIDVPSGTSEVDFWLRTSRSLQGEVQFTSFVDENETVGIPATGLDGIAVGSFNTKDCWADEEGTTWGFVELGLPAAPLGEYSWFSSWGPTRDGREKPDLVAPGAAIISARAANTVTYSEFVINPHYRMERGTSMASPHAAGAIALLLEANPNLTQADVRDLLRSNTGQSYFSNAAGLGAGGLDWEPRFGAGLLDLGFLGSDPFETNDQVAYPRQVRSGETIEGFIGSAGDEDYYQVFGLEEGDTLSATLDGLPANYDLELLIVWSINGPCAINAPPPTAVADSRNPGTVAESAVATSGPILADFLRVFPAGNAFDDTNPYTLEGVITRPEMASPHDSVATAQELPALVRMRVEGYATWGGDPDVYSFPVEAGETISASFPPPPGISFPSHRVLILDSTGTAISSWDYAVSAVAPVAGTYYVEVVQPVSIGLPGYTLEIEAR